MELGSLQESIQELAAMDPATLADEEAVICLHAQLAALEAVVARASAAFDASGAWATSGARSASAWVARSCRLPKAVARRRLRLGRASCHLPVAQAAWSNGEVSGEHLAVLANARSDATAAAMEADEEMLVACARTLAFDEFAKAVAYWSQLADPEGTEDDARSKERDRDAYLEESFGGAWLGRITLDPIRGAILKNQLGAIEDELFKADWAEAKESLGREPKLEELSRTRSQRCADAFVEMAMRAGTAAADGRRPVPLFSVLVGYETLHGRICELADGTVVSPGSLVPWLVDAEVERAVFAPSGRVEVSERSRLFTGATRRAVELRDRTCQHPFCDAPMARCQVDHIVSWAEGGPTTQENGRLLCGFHNRLRQSRPPPPGG